jgi:hypothetical protein
MHHTTWVAIDGTFLQTRTQRRGSTVHTKLKTRGIRVKPGERPSGEDSTTAFIDIGKAKHPNEGNLR